MGYRRLTREERYQISALKDSGLGVRSIARQLMRHASSISRELKRGTNGCYEPGMAHAMAVKKASSRNLNNQKLKGQLLSYVKRRITEDWSPEQIAGRLRLDGNLPKVSAQSIYRYLDKDKKEGGCLSRHLRILRKERKDRKKLHWQRVAVNTQDRISIEKRPGVVEKRARLGDYERDTIFGKARGALLLSMVDRTSRFTKLARNEYKSSDLIHVATVKCLKNEPVETITNDNGSEFSRHKQTAKALKAKVYFSHAYRSWERGSNENTNGLIRQYFPRRCAVGSAKRVAEVERILNSRPRKCLGYRTPYEVHEFLKASALR